MIDCPPDLVQIQMNVAQQLVKVAVAVQILLALLSASVGRGTTSHEQQEYAMVSSAMSA